MIARASTKITKIASRVCLKDVPGHGAVPAGGFHHPNPPPAAAAAAAEAKQHRQSHGDGDPRKSHLEPVADRVAPCFRRKNTVEPSERLAAEILHREQRFLQLLHHKLHHLIQPHFSH